MNPHELIAAHVPTVPDCRYPVTLPPELAPWYCYTPDGGHSIAVAVKRLSGDLSDPASFLVAVPVKTVQRLGWVLRDGFVVVDVPYDPDLGVVVPPEDDEF